MASNSIRRNLQHTFLTKKNCVFCGYTNNKNRNKTPKIRLRGKLKSAVWKNGGRDNVCFHSFL